MPWDFNLQELRPQLIKLLGAGNTTSSATPKASRPQAMWTVNGMSNNFSSETTSCGGYRCSCIPGMSHAKHALTIRPCVSLMGQVPRSLQMCISRHTAAQTESIHAAQLCARVGGPLHAVSYSTHCVVPKYMFAHRTHSILLQTHLPARAKACGVKFW